MKNLSAAATVVLAIGLVSSGCAHRPAKRPAPGGTEAGQDSAKAGEPSLRNQMLHAVADLKPVHFEYDRSALSPQAVAVLRANAEWIQSHPEVKIQAAGHCDQRGTVEYNLALGQRRAKAVRDYYVQLGVPEERIATISYGKERPLCAAAEEACWGKNRRAETLAAFPQDLSRNIAP